MRRLFYIALGASAGVLVVRRLTRAAERLTPAGLSSTASSGLDQVAEALREFAAEVRAGMAEREAELRVGLGLDGSHDVVDVDTAVDPHAMAVAANPFSTEPERHDPSGFGR